MGSGLAGRARQSRLEQPPPPTHHSSRNCGDRNPWRNGHALQREEDGIYPHLPVPGWAGSTSVYVPVNLSPNIPVAIRAFQWNSSARDLQLEHPISWLAIRTSPKPYNYSVARVANPGAFRVLIDQLENQSLALVYTERRLAVRPALLPPSTPPDFTEAARRSNHYAQSTDRGTNACPGGCTTCRG